MHKQLVNYAFIDSQNLILAIRSLGWRLDLRKFRVYLKEKYSVQRAYLFLGFIIGNDALYQAMQDAGYICVFRPTLEYKDGTTKGNCDAELVLQAMIDYREYKQAIIVSGDGDFHCLVKYLLGKRKLGALLIPNRRRNSALLKMKEFCPYLRFVDELKKKLSYNKKRPHKDRTL